MWFSQLFSPAQRRGGGKVIEQADPCGHEGFRSERDAPTGSCGAPPRGARGPRQTSGDAYITMKSRVGCGRADGCISANTAHLTRSLIMPKRVSGARDLAVQRLAECSSCERRGAIDVAQELPLLVPLRITWHGYVLAAETTSAITAALIIRDAPARTPARQSRRMMHDSQSQHLVHLQRPRCASTAG